MSANINVYDSSANKLKSEKYEVNFVDEINLGLLHQVAISSRTNNRNRTASTKNRAQVSGTGAKPWMQKGTGRARAGSLRSAQFRGGGIVHGPGGRVYKDRTPKLMKRKALQMALSQRHKEESFCILDTSGWESPSTKLASTALVNIGATSSVLLVSLLTENDIVKSFRNIHGLVIRTPENLSAIDVVMNDNILITKEAFQQLVEERL